MPGIVTPERIIAERAMRFNPLASLTPATLTAQLEQFERGFLCGTARTWDAIARRDDKLPALIGKRLAALARYGWEVLAVEDDTEAQAHKADIEWTLAHLKTVNAVDENERGGMALLLRKIGLAIAHRYSPHELIWSNHYEAGQWRVRCEARHVPLWHFENTTGRLRFLATLGAPVGEPLEEGSWMIATGAGLMEPSSVLYMFKRLPLGDWLNFSEAFGMPGVVGHTTAAKDSDAGRNMADAVGSYGAILSFVLYGAAENKIELARAGGSATELPFPPLVERCDRALSILWRGGDLSTMSAGDGAGQGASVQGAESHAIEQDDAEWASEIIQLGIVRRLIAFKYDGAAPKAYVRIKTRPTPETELDMKIVQTLVAAGFPVARKWASQRFGIPLARAGQELLRKQGGPPK